MGRGSAIGETRDPQSADSIGIVRANGRKAIRLPDTNHFWEILSPDFRGQLLVLWVQIEPKDSAGGFFQHEGEELFLILSGDVRLQVGDQEFSLSEGDAATISSERPHRVINSGPKAAVLIAASTPPFM
jgi:mannose-6-phosphate isomerase-like protein (cupin superfamily)